jgi:hypothetical protein
VAADVAYGPVSFDFVTERIAVGGGICASRRLTKFRLNLGQELVIGGYVPVAHGVDSVIVGYYKESELIYVARARNGFGPETRRQMARV